MITIPWQLVALVLPAEQREVAIQEAIASACVSYQLLAARGKLHAASPGAIASFAVKQARSGRHVGGRQDGACDVMSPVVRRRHGIDVVSYHRSGGTTVGWQILVIPDRRAAVADLAAFRIDFACWLVSQSHRDRKIIAALASGERNCVVAQRFGITRGRVSQLRRKYERGWWVFQGEAETMARAA